VTSRELSDLMEKKGRYSGLFSKGSKLRRGRIVDPSCKSHGIYTWNPISGFPGWKSHNHCNRNRDIPKAKWICVGHKEVSEVDRWHTISEFRGEKS